MQLVPTAGTLAQRAEDFCQLLLADLGLSITDVRFSSKGWVSFKVRTWQGVSAIVGRARLTCEIDIKGQLDCGRWAVKLSPKQPR